MQLKQAIPRAVKEFLWYRLYALYQLPHLFRPPFEYIHILGHMRSGSSLLTHLLANSPEILGFGETMLPYRSPRDFGYAQGRVRYALRQGFKVGRERYLLDKILHNELLGPTAVDLYHQKPVKLIFLLRDPIATLSSLMRTQGYSDLLATTFLVQRLNHLTALAGKLDPSLPSVYLTYAELLDQTPQALAGLQAFLGLEQPLTETYALLPTTGRLGGDRSANIRAGSILREPLRPPVEMTAECQINAKSAFRTCLTALEQNSRPLLHLAPK